MTTRPPRLAGQPTDIHQDSMDAMLTAMSTPATEMVQAQTNMPCHLRLLDVMMPGIDGQETAARVHAIDPDLPIVGQTAHVLEDDRHHCLEAGMLDRITKPIGSETLERTVLRRARRLSV